MAPRIHLKTLYYSVGVNRWACSERSTEQGPQAGTKQLSAKNVSGEALSMEGSREFSRTPPRLPPCSDVSVLQKTRMSHFWDTHHNPDLGASLFQVLGVTGLQRLSSCANWIFDQGCPKSYFLHRGLHGGLFHVFIGKVVPFSS